MSFEVAAFLWWVIGVVSFIYHWTYDNDFTKWSVLFAFGVGFIGPLAFIYGFIVHPRRPEHKVKHPENIFKKRRIE